MEVMNIVILVICCLNLLMLLSFIIVQRRNKENSIDYNEINNLLLKSQEQTRTIIRNDSSEVFKHIGGIINENLLKQFGLLKENVLVAMKLDKEARDDFYKHISNDQQKLETTLTNTLNNSIVQTEQRLENIRETMSKEMTMMRQENEKKLDEMRNVVDEKLQKTLEERISRSFDSVSKRLAEVNQGLGEMQTIAGDVSSLKRTLQSVRTRGVLGEVQLRNVIEEILHYDQYVENFAPFPNKNSRVEFAIKLPGDKDEPVYLPIDAKFPLSDYQRLLEGIEDREEQIKVERQLITTIKSAARDISRKYINVPTTTEFAIMFLPFEGLYAKVVSLGLIEVLQREFKIVIAGPTTLAALLNSIKMGFRSLAIQKKTYEVWEVFESVQNEFNKFASALENAKASIDKAGQNINTLISTRTNKMKQQFDKVASLDVARISTDS